MNEEQKIQIADNPALHIASVSRCPLSVVYLEDCVQGLKRFADKHFDLAIVDPPYGIGATNGTGKYGRLKFQNKKECWDTSIPTDEYWNELFRASKNQIVWGANYFGLPPTRGFFVWDKGEGFYNRDFAECEYAWTSFDRNAKVLNRDPLAKRDYHEGKIHPTQKPVALYEWILVNYAKPNDLILDTHLGSGSSRIACFKGGFNFVGFEIDAEYYEKQEKRFKNFTAQQRLF